MRLGLADVLEVYEYTYSEIGDFLGVSKQAISGWISGARPIPENHIKKLEEKFNIDRGYIVGELNEVKRLEIKRIRLEQLGEKTAKTLTRKGIIGDIITRKIISKDIQEKLDEVNNQIEVASLQVNINNLISKNKWYRQVLERFSNLLNDSLIDINDMNSIVDGIHSFYYPDEQTILRMINKDTLAKEIYIAMNRNKTNSYAENTDKKEELISFINGTENGKRLNSELIQKLKDVNIVRYSKEDAEFYNKIGYRIALIADYTNVSYDEEDTTEMWILAEELENCDFYNVIGEMTVHIASTILDSYSNNNIIMVESLSHLRDLRAYHWILVEGKLEEQDEIDKNENKSLD